MFLPDKAVDFSSVISHTSSTSRVAAGIVISAAMIVAIVAALPSTEARSAVDRKDIQKMTANYGKAAASQRVFLETDPAWYAESAAGETAIYLPPESLDTAMSRIETF